MTRMRLQIILTMFFIAGLFLSGNKIHAQVQGGELIVVSDRVGEVIDLQERNRYKLFQDIKGFQSAKIWKLPNGKYVLEISFLDEKTGERNTQKFPEEQSKIQQLRKYINRFRGKGTGNRRHESSNKFKQIADSDTLIAITLKSGSTLKGKIIQKSPTRVVIQTLDGIEVKIPVSSITSIKRLRGYVGAGRFRRLDPNYSRLLFAPTGRPLRKGDGYFSDFYVFFPSVAYGVTSNLSIMAGFSIVPGTGLGNQLKYVAPRLGFRASDHFAMSIGALYTAFKDEFAAGIAFAVASFGPQDKNFTAGVGLGYTKEKGEDFQFADRPIFMFGGNIRLSNNIALLTENWFVTGKDFQWSNQPFTLAIRFFGDRLAADVGAILVGKVLEEGLPIPWLSFVYNFGRK